MLARQSYRRDGRTDRRTDGFSALYNRKEKMCHGIYCITIKTKVTDMQIRMCVYIYMDWFKQLLYTMISTKTRKVTAKKRLGEGFFLYDCHTFHQYY